MNIKGKRCLRIKLPNLLSRTCVKKNKYTGKILICSI